MKTNLKKGLSLVLALVMVFAMTTAAFASTGTCTIKAYIPTAYENYFAGTTVEPNIPSYYTDSSVSGMKGLSCTVELSKITGCAVETPSGFTGLLNTDSELPYLATAFDVLYTGLVAAGETSETLEYGFDMYSYTETGTPMHGIYLNKIGNLTSDTFDSYYDSTTGSGYWVGYSWSLYDVPANVNFNPAQPDEAYKTNYYANNIVGTEGHTYYMIYECNEEIW